MPWTKSCASSPTVHRAPSILCRIDAVTQRWQPVLCTDFAVGALRGRIQRSACAVRVPRPQFKAIEPHALPIIQAMSINGSATDRRIVAAALGAEEISVERRPFAPHPSQVLQRHHEPIRDHLPHRYSRSSSLPNLNSSRGRTFSSALTPQRPFGARAARDWFKASRRRAKWSQTINCRMIGSKSSHRSARQLRAHIPQRRNESPNGAR